MKSILGFLKAVILGGLLVVLPLTAFWLLISELFNLVVALAMPIAEVLPESLTARPRFPILLAIGLIGLTSLIAGLLVRSSLMRRFGGWVEVTILAPLPLFRGVKNLIHGMLGASNGDSFRPVLYTSTPGQADIAYLVEDLGDGRVVIMLPFCPTPMAGTIKIVSADKIERIPARLGDATRVLSQWGVGTAGLLKVKPTPAAAD